MFAEGTGSEMRHRRAGRKLGRNTNHRKALLRNLANSLIEHGKIVTTLSKAKTLRPRIEKLITLARNDTTANRRLAFRRLQRKSTVKRLFETLAPRFTDRPGGYTRILKLGPRKGDGAEMAQIEFVS